MSHTPLPNKELFYNQVWALVRKIPRGKVATYGQLTKMLPKPDTISDDDYKIYASRWVGLAMAASPDDAPWHRVINSQGKVSHPDAGKQKFLLEEEGVFFSKGKIDLHEFQWLVSDQNNQPAQGKLF